MLQGAGPEVAKGRDGTILKEILDKTTERISNDLTNQPGVEAEVRYFAGKIYRDLGDYQAAEIMQRRVVALQKQLHPKGHADLPDALSNLAIILMLRGQLPEAEVLSRESVVMGKQCLGPEDTNVAAWLINLGTVLTHESKFQEAEPLYRDALGINRKLLGNEHREVATWLNNLGK